MIVFRRKPKIPLQHALALTDAAVEIAYAYKRDMSYCPDEKELALLKGLAQSARSQHVTLEYIANRLERRIQQKATQQPQSIIDIVKLY